MEFPNTSLQAIELNLSCLGQAYSDMPAIGPGYKNMEPRSILTVLCVPFIVCPLRSMVPSLARLFKRFCTAGTNGHLELSLFWQASEDCTRYDQDPEIHNKPKRVSLPVSKAQVVGCLKVLVGGPLEWDPGI